MSAGPLQMEPPPEQTDPCPACHKAGWVIETNPTVWPATLEVIPCILPGCPWSGRPVEKILVPSGIPIRPIPAP